MLNTRRFVVEFDDGPSIEVALKSRDMAVLERDGADFQTTPPIRASYLLAFAALSRMKRQGLIDIDLPVDADALMDVADLEPVADEDAEGNGSGQAVEPG